MFRVNIQSWLSNEQTQALVRAGLSDRRFAKSTVEAHMGGPAAAIAHYRDNTTPTVIILESEADGPGLLQQIDELAEVCDAGTNVVVIGSANDITLYRELVRRGVSDYLVKPFEARQLFEAVSGVCFDPEAPPMGRMIAFLGSRGGSGSSTISHNVAYELGEAFGDEIIVVDMDLDFGTAALDFNLEVTQGVHSALSDPDRLDDVLLDRFLLEYSDKLSLLASPATLDHNILIRPEALEKLMDLVKRRASFAILDLPHRWSPWMERVLIDADEVCVVGLLDLASLRDTKNLIDRLKKVRGETAAPKMVINHEGAFRRTELSAKDFENAVGVKPSAVIPHDAVLFGNAANNGQLLFEVNPKHRARETIRQLAIELSGRQPGRSKAGASLFSRLLKPKKAMTKTAKKAKERA